jgi:hypothetical protein
MATWIFQVMPVFFIVGGFANAASWESARRDPERRRAWQAVRLRRLLVPTVPLVAIWCTAAAIARYAEVPPELIRDGSRAALLPIWFLAVYIMVTVVVPVSTGIWRRYGLFSVAALAAAAICVDLIALVGGEAWLRWSNYGFIWLAMHQLGSAVKPGCGGRITALSGWRCTSSATGGTVEALGVAAGGTDQRCSS